MTALLFIWKNKTWVLIAILIMLIASVTILTKQLIRQKDISYRWEQNYKGELKRYKDKTGADAITIQETQLTLKELKQSSDSTIQSLFVEAKNLGNRNRELSQLLRVKTEVQYDSVFIPITDTLIIRKTDTVTKYSSYNDKWLDVSLALHKNAIEVLDYRSRDEIVITVGWHKDRKFIGRWFERKKWDADIKSLNPNSTITHSVNVRVTGKRGRK